MSEIADFLRTRYAEARECAETVHDLGCGEIRYDGTCDCGLPGQLLADLDAKLALIDEFDPPALVEPEPVEHEEGWCCSGHVSECPLCPQYGTRLDDPCPGHQGTGPNKTRVVEARLHARFAHPGYEYRTTEGPRKQWDDIDQPPHGDDGEPEPGWERNVDAGRPGMGWDRFDYTEESYWRRPRPDGPRPDVIPRPLRILAQPFAGQPGHKGEAWAP